MKVIGNKHWPLLMTQLDVGDQGHTVLEVKYVMVMASTSTLGHRSPSSSSNIKEPSKVHCVCVK